MQIGFPLRPIRRKSITFLKCNLIRSKILGQFIQICTSNIFFFLNLNDEPTILFHFRQVCLAKSKHFAHLWMRYFESITFFKCYGVFVVIFILSRLCLGKTWHKNSHFIKHWVELVVLLLCLKFYWRGN